MHHAAERYNVGVYFEANGHGTVLFSQPTIDILAEYQPSTPAQSRAVEHLVSLTELINQTVGDALSDMLLVEVVLSHKSYNGEEWDSLYADLPNRLAKVSVPNRNAFKTEDAERRLVSPAGLQTKIEDLVNRYQGGRSFVRPSGTEDVVRVYAEAALRTQADGEFLSVSVQRFLWLTSSFRALHACRRSGVRRSRWRSRQSSKRIFVGLRAKKTEFCDLL